jgi:surface polysaccharide O-acyltransferase-like enzyme
MKKNEEAYCILKSKKINLIILDKKNNRNYGIDLSRIISMFLIINIHIIYHGGPLFKTQKFSIEHKIFIFLNIICASGVNTFGLISGCIGFNSYKFSNLFYLLFTTIFYSLTISHLFKYFKPNLVDYSTYFSFIIVITDYWYFISYFTIYFFFPLINVGITQIKEKTMKHFVINLFLMFSFLNEIMKYTEGFKSSDIFNLKNGFCYSWLLILYLFGSYLGRFKIDLKKKRKNYFYIICFFIIIILALIKTKLLINKMIQNNTVFDDII